MRKRISDRISRAISWRVDERLAAQPRSSEVDDALAAVAALTDRIAENERNLKIVSERVDDLREHVDFMGATYDRMEPQLAALEWRMEDMRYRVRHIANDGELDELAAEARAEHERARIRLELASHYEERLRRLEEPGNA